MTRRPPLLALALAGVLSVGTSILPQALAPVAPDAIRPLLAAVDAPVVRAAAGLAIRTKTTYVVDPGDGVIRVTVDIDASNEKPNSDVGGVTTRYYYDGLNLGVQPEARNIRASDGGRSLGVTVEDRKGYRLLTLRFAQSVFYGETATPRLQFDLPAGKPRSASDVRVGSAFVSFLAWAFGDGGSIRVEVPKGFDVEVQGAEMTRATRDDGTQVLKATTENAISWFAWINARNDDALTRTRLALENGEKLLIRAWPEDTRWQKRVAKVMANAIPQLSDRIGLPWPVDGPLDILEVHTPLLEGYAGFYDPETDVITVTEELDDVTIVHEASHAWFNQALFDERWINEGLAETYAADVVRAIGGEPPAAAKVSRDDPAAFPLDDWPGPSPIRDAQAGARERYGYDASTTVIRKVVDAAGEAGMRAMFAAADARTTAYVGDGPAEPTTLPTNDWRRFLDLAEELGGAADVDALLRTWALTDTEAASLDARTAARADYASLRAAGAGWAVPVGIRLAMDGWSFDDAEAGMTVASSVLGTRDDIAALAADERLAPPDLEAAYEGAADTAALRAISDEAAKSEAALRTVVAATDASTGERDWLTQIGLAGKTPDADLASARTAWEAGSYELASTLASTAAATLAVAPEAGRGRVLVVGGFVGLVLVLVLIVVGTRRRSSSARRRAAAASAENIVNIHPVVDAQRVVDARPVVAQPVVDSQPAADPPPPPRAPIDPPPPPGG